MVHQDDTKQWLQAVAAFLNLSLSELATKAGLAPSTVTRYVYDKSNSLGITQRSLDAISTYSGVPKAVMPGQRRLPGLGDNEVVPYHSLREDPLPDWVITAIDAHRGARNDIEPWVMKSWALDMLGIVPGDVLLVDRSKRAKAGDIVIAQLNDLATGKSELVARRYDPPFVFTYSAKSGPSRPEQVDDSRVVILGVESGVIRPRN